MFVHSIHLLYFISNIWIHLFNSQELITQLCDFNRSHQVNSVERTPKSKKRNILSTNDVPVMSENKKSIFHQELLQHESVQLMVLNKFSSHFSSPDIPKPLSDFYNLFLLGKPYEDILLECVWLQKEVFFIITKPQSEAVAKATINQFKSPIWNRYHYSLFTASQSYYIFHTNKDNPSMLLWKRYPAESTFSTEETRYVYCLTPVLYICK